MEFYIHKGRNYERIIADEVLFFEADQDHTLIHFVGKRKPHRLHGNLKSVEKKMGSSFFRVHRGFLINRSKIKSVHHDTITMEGDLIVPSGRLYKPDLIASLVVL